MNYEEEFVEDEEKTFDDEFIDAFDRYSPELKEEQDKFNKLYLETFEDPNKSELGENKLNQKRLREEELKILNKDYLSIEELDKLLQ